MRRLICVIMAFLITACASNQGKQVPTQPESLPVPPQENRAQPTAPLQPTPQSANRLPSSVNAVPSGNPFTDTFVRHELPAIALQPDPQGPKIYKGEQKEEDYNRMLERGYDMVGYSNFEAGDVLPELALQHAKNIKADMVLVYSTVAGGTPSSMKLERMREQALNADGVTATASEADQTRYNYFASYWVRLAPPLIGVHVNGPGTSDLVGLPVVAVVKQSPAAIAGLMSGDVLTQIGDVTLDRPEKLTAAAIKYAGKTVPLSYRRGSATQLTQLTLNQAKPN